MIRQVMHEYYRNLLMEKSRKNDLLLNKMIKTKDFSKYGYWLTMESKIADGFSYLAETEQDEMEMNQETTYDKVYSEVYNV